MVIHSDPGEGNTSSSPWPYSPSEMSLCDSDPSDPCTEPPAKAARTIAPSRRWIFTWNNYPSDWESYFVVNQAPEGKLVGWMGEKEIAPTTGTPHIQGWIDFGEGNKYRPSSLKLPKQISWRSMRGTPEQNYAYCSKEDADFTAWGSAKRAKPFSVTIDFSISPWMSRLYDILCTEPNDRDVWWLWEPIGKAGKTRFQKWYDFAHKGDVLVLDGKAHDMKCAIVKFKERIGAVPRVILCNVPRSRQCEHISWAGIEQVKDMLFFSGKYESGMINDKHPHVVFFANWAPEEEQLSGDRWHIVRLPDGKGQGKVHYETWT